MTQRKNFSTKEWRRLKRDIKQASIEFGIGAMVSICGAAVCLLGLAAYQLFGGASVSFGYEAVYRFVLACVLMLSTCAAAQTLGRAVFKLSERWRKLTREKSEKTYKRSAKVH